MQEVTDKKVYQCEYCGKLSLSKGGMTVHERCCKSNPSNWVQCAGCKHLERENYEVDGTEGQRCSHCTYYYRGWDNKFKCNLKGSECEGKIIITEFICKKTGNKMYYPKKVLMMRKDKKEAILARCDCPMPNECNNYEPFDCDFLDYDEL